MEDVGFPTLVASEDVAERALPEAISPEIGDIGVRQDLQGLSNGGLRIGGDHQRASEKELGLSTQGLEQSKLPNETIPSERAVEQHVVFQPDESSDRPRNLLVQHIYHGNLVKLDTPRQEQRSATQVISEEKEWEKAVGGMWRIPEDGRWHLTFAKEWLHSLSLEDAREHLKTIKEDEEKVSTWINRHETTVFDLLDDGTQYRYTKGTQSKKPELDMAGPVLSREPVTNAPWRRVIYLTSPESRRTELVCAIAHQASIKQRQTIPSNISVGRRMETIKFDISYHQIYAVRSEQFQALPYVEPWNFWDTIKLDWKPKKTSDTSQRVLIRNCYTLVAVAAQGDMDHWTLLQMRPATLAQRIPKTFSTKYFTQDMAEAFMLQLADTMPELNVVWKSNLEYFKNLTTDHTAIRDMVSYKDIAVDDDLTISTLYSWASNVLENLDANISENIDTIKKALEEAKRFQERTNKSPGEGIQVVQEQLETLQCISREMSKKRAQVKELLRASLSTVQAVGNQRSIQLGRSVRCLAVITTIYAPMSFFVALLRFSDAKFSFRTVAIIGSLIAFITYVAVSFIVGKHLLKPLWQLGVWVSELIKRLRRTPTAQPDHEMNH